ncbi:hypothetical protein MBUL_04478 (plasmid) [Methylobacterium bullatum]|uniref:Uncharacterized protein n=1 Tax=Methylobacterium bullatum TaxID=570505 RepID=A0A679J8F7_9HYPH|nr:hypothetical protein MBUL_04478 [Methylobacterium bullatum]
MNNCLDIKFSDPSAAEPILQLSNSSAHQILGAALSAKLLWNSYAKLEAEEIIQRFGSADHNQRRYHLALKASVGQPHLPVRGMVFVNVKTWIKYPRP